ncbi:GNAT family N-acetyltransferase [Fulvimonas soli]|uniref:Putative acetyltransferase n=1 Tax=Fulvimonas soli TaxID=155197 RepID=A0A316HZ90_9GAMM|nr:GNAT family N-acetyltransferase [Fulvimonas soli]PWK85309.1 putative acetyltransferase [Fulvimonas soli]TNY26271.1 GNAT family N-acetyltransferase [Fulvimonas soli]
MLIRPDDPTHPAVHALLREHLQNMVLHSPPESIHALDVDGLRRPEISFWTAWEDGDLLGCGALKRLDSRHAELKSMRTAAAHLRKGVARAMLAHLLGEAKARGYRRVSLETGAAAAFAPAHRLYESFGFACCGPFADYVEDPYSVFMSREL